MKRKYAVFAVTFVVSLLIGIQAVEIVDANPFPPPFCRMTVTIYSPSNQTYGSSVLLNFSAVSGHVFYLISDIGEGGGDRYSGNFYYVLDGQDMMYAGTKIENAQMTETTSEQHDFKGTASLTNLTQGTHSITVYWGVPIRQEILNSAYCSGTMHFNVDSQLTPTPSQVIQPSNSTTQPISGAEVDLVLPLVVASSIIVLGVAGTLLVYFRRRKGKP